MIEPKTVMRALRDEGADLAAARKRIARLERAIRKQMRYHSANLEIGCCCSSCNELRRALSKGKKR